VTIVGRATRCVVAWAVCLNRTPELMQSVVDAAPHARNYYSDAFNAYRELCWWGTHQAMYDKSQTYSVEGTNADLRHYLARLGRRSRCFSRAVQDVVRGTAVAGAAAGVGAGDRGAQDRGGHSGRVEGG
jgi:IS1 family transposase